MTSGGIIFTNRKSQVLRIFPLIQPLFPLGNDYFHQNNIDLHVHVEIIHCMQAMLPHWSREPITTVSRPSLFMLEVSGQLTTPDRFSYTPAVFLLSRSRPQFCGLAEFKPILLLSRPEIYSKPSCASTNDRRTQR